MKFEWGEDVNWQTKLVFGFQTNKFTRPITSELIPVVGCIPTYSKEPRTNHRYVDRRWWRFLKYSILQLHRSGVDL